MTFHDQVYVDGQWIYGGDAAPIKVINPATEEIAGHAPDADSGVVDRAANAARHSFDQGEWRLMPVEERIGVIEQAFSLIEARLDEVSRVVIAEMGLPLQVAKLQLPGAFAAGRFFMDIARSEPLMDVRPGVTPAAVYREPVGVVASIAPWNGPFNMAISKIIPPLVTGCSVVFKPAPETPLDAYVIAEAFHEAGLPPGVFNLVTGGADTGRALVAHPEIDKVSFTGSTAAGREIGQQCGQTFKRMQLELGGKSAAIVLDDADLAAALPGLATGAFANTGQVCASYSRILAPRSLYDEVVDGLVAAARSSVIGDPQDPATTMGPLVSARQRHRVEGYIQSGLSEGARLATGGGRPADISKGWFIEPTVFVDARNDMKICQEEIFGPVGAVIAYDSLDEAIAIANDSPYGLHGGVFTTDPDRALRVARSIRTGTFSVNSWTYNKQAPFGGVKCSGVGRDTGREGVTSYYELKTVNFTTDMADALRIQSPDPATSRLAEQPG